MSCDDFDEGIPGICPPNVTCKISHSSTYANQVGVYPSDFLPSKSTTWHASFAVNFSAAGTAGGPLGQGVGFSLGLLGGGAGLIGAELVPNLGQVINFQSYHTIIFARTANRINVAHVLTQSELNTAGVTGDTGEILIDVGEFIFEAVAVTDQRIDESTTGLTEQELEEIVSSGENESDRAFRKLFEISIPNNRLNRVDFNELGVEYRLDNNTDKERLALDSAGLGDLKSPSYRDASSKKLVVDIGANRIEEDGSTDRPLVPGDVIYLTYVGVKEHYIRQNINASWQIFDFGSQFECITLLLSFKVQNFRFYEWDLKPEGQDIPTRLAGWRVVESFNSRVNTVAPIGTSANRSVLGDLAIGNGNNGIQSSQYIPGIVTETELRAFIDDRSSMPIVEVNHFASEGNLDYHPNSGTNGNPTTYQDSAWYQRANFNAYNEEGKTSEHVLFNVHPKALKKRDLEKWGIERFLAVEVEIDVKSGKPTFFPFMDDPEIDDPTSSIGAKKFLDNTNFKFEPIEPLSKFGPGNFKGCCGSLGTFTTIFQLLSGGLDQNVTQRDGINSFHRFSSNLITEKFDRDTRVLVERNLAQASELGPTIIAIEGSPTAGGAISCIDDPSHSYSFVVHNNEDAFLVYNPFKLPYLEDTLRILSFRPDQDAPPLEGNNDPTLDQFEPRLGFTGNAGHRPGRRPGQALSISDFAPIESLLYRTTNKDEFIADNPAIPEDNISEIEFEQGDKIVIPTDLAYIGRVDIFHSLSTDEDNDGILVLLKLGDVVSGAIDGLRVTKKSENRLLRVGTKWMRGNRIEIIGDRVKDMRVSSITIVGLDVDKSSDFLTGPITNTIDDKVPFNERSITSSLLFHTEVMSISEDSRSVIYIFFRDDEGGISAIASNTFGNEWHYFYGIVEPISGSSTGDRPEFVNDPFCVTDFGTNACYLFFRFIGGIFCKKVHFKQFLPEDMNLVERFVDRFTPGSELGGDITLPKESASLYSADGQTLRRNSLGNMAAGETSEKILELFGFDKQTKKFNPFERRQVEIRQSDGSISTEDVAVRKHPIARGPRSAFTDLSVDTLFFSAYRNDRGIMRLWFMSDVQLGDVDENGAGGGGRQLQCHYSTDDGINWYDQWEFIAYGLNRMRFDTTTGQPFIDQGSSGESPENREGTLRPGEQISATFGINVHWSRLKRHKIQEGELGRESESQVIDIDSPYVFYQSYAKKVFLFYIYEGCLLCKIFSDSIFIESAQKRRDPDTEISGMNEIKNLIERGVRARFVDGALNAPELIEELHDHYNAETDERLVDGNIVFSYQFALEKFNSSRTVFPQRVCAHSMKKGMIRVYYKFQGSDTLKSAIWTGNEFWAEDFLRNKATVGEFEFPPPQGGTPVLGGFGSEAFGA